MKKVRSSQAVILILNKVKHSFSLRIVKDSHREKAPSNKTPALTKKMNMGIWVVGTSNQLSIRGS